MTFVSDGMSDRLRHGRRRVGLLASARRREAGLTSRAASAEADSWAAVAVTGRRVGRAHFKLMLPDV